MGAWPNGKYAYVHCIYSVNFLVWASGWEEYEQLRTDRKWDMAQHV